MEHWNNAADKKYTRNLGTGNGIELKSVEQGTATSVANQEIGTPEYFTLFQNYPNPFNPTTNIRYQIPINSFVTIKIFDILGKEIETLVYRKQTAGTYDVEWNASEFSSGIYFYRLTTDGFSEVKKMILIK